jgi:hypothetical protein
VSRGRPLGTETLQCLRARPPAAHSICSLTPPQHACCCFLRYDLCGMPACLHPCTGSTALRHSWPYATISCSVCQAAHTSWSIPSAARLQQHTHLPDITTLQLAPMNHASCTPCRTLPVTCPRAPAHPLYSTPLRYALVRQHTPGSTQHPSAICPRAPAHALYSTPLQHALSCPLRRSLCVMLT